MNDPNRQIKFSPYQISDSVLNGGVFSPEECKALANKLMTIYDSNGDGVLDSLEIGYMQSDCYRAMNKGFNPTPTDIASYSRVLDQNGQGRVSTNDIESLCFKLFRGDFQSTKTVTPPQSQKNNDQPFTRIQVTKKPSVINPGPDRANKMVQDRLEVARRIFNLVDTQHQEFITENEVPQLLKETYKQMGMDFEASQEDVELWMQMADTDQDGKVSLEDYENLVLKSLRQQGILQQ